MTTVSTSMWTTMGSLSGERNRGETAAASKYSTTRPSYPEHGEAIRPRPAGAWSADLAVPCDLSRRRYGPRICQRTSLLVPSSDGVRARRHFLDLERAVRRGDGVVRILRNEDSTSHERMHVALELLSARFIQLLAQDQSDRKSTRLNSSHGYISYAVFC